MQIVAQGVLTHAWVVAGPERPLAIYIIRLGGNAAKLMAAALTPTLTAALGWTGACRIYAAAILSWTAVWMAAAQPCPPDPPPPAPPAQAGDTPTAVTKPTAGIVHAQRQRRPPFTPKLLLTRPALAMFVAQTSSALCEINLVSLYLPTFYTEQLGVPLRQLARYTTPPMA